MLAKRLALIVLICSVFLAGFGSLGLAAQKTTHVKGYTKKDGTHVAAHERKAPKKGGSTTSTTKSGAEEERKKAKRQQASAQPRDSKGRFVRSSTAKHQFMKDSGYPKGRPGYVVDHIVPLACGGADSPSNMQWQTVQEAKAKDRIERHGCH